MALALCIYGEKVVPLPCSAILCLEVSRLTAMAARIGKASWIVHVGESFGRRCTQSDMRRIMLYIDHCSKIRESEDGSFELAKKIRDITFMPPLSRYYIRTPPLMRRIEGLKDLRTVHRLPQHTWQLSQSAVWPPVKMNSSSSCQHIL
jgi:hypothetical protein